MDKDCCNSKVAVKITHEISGEFITAEDDDERFYLIGTDGVC